MMTIITSVVTLKLFKYYSADNEPYYILRLEMKRNETLEYPVKIINNHVICIIGHVQKLYTNGSIMVHGHGKYWNIEKALIDHDYNLPISTYIRLPVDKSLATMSRSKLVLGKGTLYEHHYEQFHRKILDYGDYVNRNSCLLLLNVSNLTMSTAGASAYDIVTEPYHITLVGHTSVTFVLNKLRFNSDPYFMLRSRYSKIGLSLSSDTISEVGFAHFTLSNLSDNTVTIEDTFLQVMFNEDELDILKLMHTLNMELPCPMFYNTQPRTDHHLKQETKSE